MENIEKLEILTSLGNLTLEFIIYSDLDSGVFTENCGINGVIKSAKYKTKIYEITFSTHSFCPEKNLVDVCYLNIFKNGNKFNRSRLRQKFRTILKKELEIYFKYHPEFLKNKIINNRKKYVNREILMNQTNIKYHCDCINDYKIKLSELIEMKENMELEAMKEKLDQNILNRKLIFT